MSRRVPPVAAVLSLVLVAACSGGEEVTYDADQAQFVSWQRSASCLITKSLKPSIKMCVTGGGDLARARQLTEDSLKKWLDAVRPIEPNVTASIVFGCDAPDGWLTLGGGEYSSPGNVHVWANSAPGTFLHEFGHAFACLGDTYVNGRAGWCQSGQPHSIMCDGLLRNDLSSDDIAGAQAQFRALVGPGSNGRPPPPADPDDTDGDGVPNAEDLCPNTPAGSHVWRDQNGGVYKGCAWGERIPSR